MISDKPKTITSDFAFLRNNSFDAMKLLDYTSAQTTTTLLKYHENSEITLKIPESEPIESKKDWDLVSVAFLYIPQLEPII